MKEPSVRTARVESDVDWQERGKTSQKEEEEEEERRQTDVFVRGGGTGAMAAEGDPTADQSGEFVLMVFAPAVHLVGIRDESACGLSGMKEAEVGVIEWRWVEGFGGGLSGG
jgi:hypothetical protein